MSTILIVEDSERQRAALRDVLRLAGCCDQVLEARDGIEGLKLLLSEPVDLVLCDLEMPGLDGAKLLRVARTRKGQGIPFLVLTASADLERRARLLREGARDAIAKPWSPADLIARVELHLELVRLQEELLAKNRLLEELSTTDSLTGLRNRRYLDEMLRLDFLRAERFRTPLSVVMVDVDGFKQVNDRYGHPVGDEVLRAVAQRLVARQRKSDLAGRYGGEEFLLILSNVGPRGALIAAERWRTEVEHAPVETTVGPVPVTVSCGVATRRPEMERPEALLAAADAALYGAKAGGRNCVVLDREPTRG